jgi:hypothetical protein
MPAQKVICNGHERMKALPVLDRTIVTQGIFRKKLSPVQRAVVLYRAFFRRLDAMKIKKLIILHAFC